jgi:hypothetical protein
MAVILPSGFVDREAGRRFGVTVQVSRKFLASIVVLAVAIGLLVAASVLASGRRIPPAEAPLRVLPADVTAVNFTDWSSLRDSYADPLSEGRQRDLTTRSAVAGYAEAMKQAVGVDVTELDWEVAGATRDGLVLALGLGGLKAGSIEHAMRRSGFTATGGGFAIDDSTLARLGLGELRVLRYVSLRDGQLLAADSAPGLASMLAVHGGDEPRLGSVQRLRTEIAALLPALSLYVATASEACADADPSRSGPEIAGQVRVALSRSGRLATYRWAGRSLRDDGRMLSIALEFRSAPIAAEQARVREKLSHGPFIGRSGRVEDMLRLRVARHKGTVTVLEFARAADGSNVVMSSVGPMLFAACA